MFITFSCLNIFCKGQISCFRPRHQYISILDTIYILRNTIKRYKMPTVKLSLFWAISRNVYCIFIHLSILPILTICNLIGNDKL